MVRVLPQFLAADCDEIVNVQCLAVNIGRSKKVLLLPLITCHHLRLCLRQVREVPLDICTRTILQHHLLLLLGIVFIPIHCVQFSQMELSIMDIFSTSVYACLSCAIVVRFLAIDLPRSLRLSVRL